MTMASLQGVRIKCVPCGTYGDIGVIDGQYFDPPGWTRRGSETLCPTCNKRQSTANLHPEVQLAAEKVVHTIQSLIATELSFQPMPGQSIVLGSDGMSRRMKRCELLSKYADVVMTVYGNIVGFRLAERGAFGRTTLTDVCTACEDLLKAEIAFSEARAAKPPYRPMSGLQGSFSHHRGEYNNWATEYDDGPEIAGPLFRFSEIAKVAQKLSQLVATRAGEFSVTAEDKIIDNAVEGVGNGRIGYNPLHEIGGNDTQAIQRQFMMMIQKFMEKQVEKQTEAEARIAARDHVSLVDQLEQLIDVRDKMQKTGRTTNALDAKINVIEAQLNQETQSAIVESAINAEATAKDITPKLHHATPPPDDDEIEYLRKSIGDEAVKSGFPVEFARATQREAE
jgi:hypothetical protein